MLLMLNVLYFCIIVSESKVEEAKLTVRWKSRGKCKCFLEKNVDDVEIVHFMRQ